MRIPRRLPVYPMGDSEDFFFGTDNDYNLYFNGTYLCLDGPAHEIRIDLRTAATAMIYGGITANDSLMLRANTVDTTCHIIVSGTHIYYNAAAGCDHYFYTGAVLGLDIHCDATETLLQTFSDNRDLFLLPHGTGYVKFGTYDATAALASTGFIPIKDALGNIRKLMVQA